MMKLSELKGGEIVSSISEEGITPMITPDQIKLIVNTKDQDKLDNFIKYLPDILEKYSINTPLRISHFLAQCSHESGQFSVFVENLNYGAKGLRNVFGKYFPTDQMALEYERKPEKIANLVYANRMGNGPPESGDGFRYRGRGIIQITGREEYNIVGKGIGVDIVANPDLVDPSISKTYQYCILTAGEFWKMKNFNSWADKDDIMTITRLVNGGFNGLDGRKAELARIKPIMGI